MHNDFTFESLRSDEVPTSLDNQEKFYLVYESVLLLLFTICMACKIMTTIIDKSVSGSFLCITQFCWSMAVVLWQLYEYY